MRAVTIGNATLYLGDCRKVLSTLESIDVVITDPPYGAQTHQGARTHSDNRYGKDTKIRKLVTFDPVTETQFLEDISVLCDLSRRWVVATCEWKFLNALEQTGQLVRFGVWVKRNGAPQFTGDRPGVGWEAVAILHRKGKKRWNGGGKHAVWDIPKVHGYHPTEKPLALVAQFVKDFSDDGETILDPFMGSGTTGVAALNLGRKFIGIELDPEYFEVACKRLEDASRSVSLLNLCKQPLRPEQRTLTGMLHG